MATYYQITKWYCRLGNNMIQLTNAIFYAIQNKIDFVYMAIKHDYLSSQVINISGTQIPFVINTAICKLNHEFYFTEKISKFKQPTKSDARDLFNKYILPVYIHKDIHYGAPLDTSNTLYIHIRSGDIFNKAKPHYLYVQPPLAYYDRIIMNENPDHIILVSEDRLNPCTDALLAKYADKIKFVSNPDPVVDIAMLCRARTIVFGFGTFSFYVMCVSNNLEKVWFPKYDNNIHKPIEFNGINTEWIPHKGYLKPGEWKNTPSQCRLMLTYKYPG